MKNIAEIQAWLVARIADLLEIAPESIDVNEPFDHYGVSSLEIVALSGDLEEWLGRRLAPSLVYDHPTIMKLSRHLVEGKNDQPAPDPTQKPVNQGSTNEPIAVIGIGCRFPGADDPEAFWELLQSGKDCISEVPSDRWNKEAFFNPDPSVPGKSISNWGGFLDKVDVFDPFFFGISPAEAKKMDPQQRLLLELSFEALDDAGLVKEELADSNTGVFVGISVNEYSQYQFSNPSEINGHSGTGSALSIAANRLSYFYDFRGPSIALDTACSSSLSAVHLACQSLRNGECSMALAGGVNIILSPVHSIAFTKAGVLAPDGRCKTFDARANGYVRGEGGGLIVLKTLSAARADGDPIHALILGSTMKQDGRTNGLMAPSQEAQEAMLREACRKAMVAPEDIQYVEAHGTGTLLGDSIEAEALGAVMGQNRSQSLCLLGSVKSNIGHLESAAGIAGLIKVILSIRHRSLPPSVHFQTPNPHIPFDDLNLEVNAKSRPWPVATGPLLAGVSSFGFGGTIVHTIISDAVEPPKASALPLDTELKTDQFQLLPLSANSPEGLDKLAATFMNLLTSGTSVSVSDICYAASSRRSKYNLRIVAKGNSREELFAAVGSFMRREPSFDLILGEEANNHHPQLVFVFPGQGGQWKGMGRELIQREPVFRQVIEQIDQLGQLYASWSLMDILLNQDSSDLLDNIEVVQPTLFAIQIALTELWKSWGITPDSVVGHSMGEVAAAYVAGGLNLEDAIRVIYLRSQLMMQLRGQGGMLVTELSQAQANELLEEYSESISIAAINSPGSTVLSGKTEELHVIAKELDRRNLFCKLVNVDVASHNHQMDSVRDELLEVLAGLNPQTTKLPIYSTVSGGRNDGIRLDAEYWMDNLRKPVLFSKAINELLQDGYTYFVEIGPHPILLGSIQQVTQHWELTSRLLPSLHREKPSREVLFSTLASLYCGGFDIDWHQLYPRKSEFIHLPSPYWQHQRYWMDIPSGSPPGYSWQNNQLGATKIHPFLGERLEMADSKETFLWQTNINTATHPFLTDHKIEGNIVFPAAAYIEMALQSAHETDLHPSHTLTDFTLREKMVLRENSPTTVQVHLSPEENQIFRFDIYSRNSKGEEWVKHATGLLIPKETVNLSCAVGPSPEALRQHHQSQITAQAFYQGLSTTGVEYGPSFQVVQRLWIQDNLALGLIDSQENLSSGSTSFQFHPTTMDACLQVLAATHKDTSGRYRYLPIGCSSIRYFSKPSQQLWSWVYRYPDSESGKDQIRADIRIFNSDNLLVSEFIGFRFQRVGQSSIQRLKPADIWLYRLEWRRQDLPQPSTTIKKGKRAWLIFADHTELGDALVKKLEDQGDTCHVFHIQDIQKTSPEELSNLISKFVGEITTPIYGIVHLWGLSIPPAPNADFNQMANYGSNSILYLVQALAGRLAGSPSLWLVTQGAQSVMDAESISVAQSAILGLGKVISFEFPELKCIRVDLDPNGLLKDSLTFLFKQISTEDREDQIAYRAGNRFVMRLLPYSAAGSTSKQNLAIGPDRTYLITGGMGALGLETAKWLVRKGARHLVLVGRSAPTTLVEKTINQIREEGCEVYIALADVGNRNQLKKVFQHIEKEMPLLSGIVHSAGVLDDGSLLNLDHARMKKVTKPKIEGAWYLHELSLPYSLDFFLLYSSAVSVLGSPGQGNYSAASAYLDALAHYRQRLNLSGMSINWGPWADIGLAAETSERLREQNVVQQHLIKEISIEQGLETLELLMNQVKPQVVVLPFDLKNLIELYPTAAGMPFLAEVGGSDTHVARLYARPKLPQQYIAPRNDIERKLAELWRNTLHIDRVGVQDSFFELGGDSVLASQILSLAQKNFGIRINPQEAFKAFTIERLAEMLETEIIRKIEAMSEEEVQEKLSQKD